MSKSVSKILYGAVNCAMVPLSSRQKAKTRARVADMLYGCGDTVVNTNHGEISFFAGRGAVIASAVARFHEDEPETLFYIDTIVGEGDIFWDIGANVGLYTLYAAKRGATVYAFEPSVFNFALLVDHLRLNDLSKQVKPLCMAFSDTDGLADLQMAEVSAGHASNSIGAASNQFGEFKPAFQQTVIAMRADNFAKQFNAMPDHIKLDVDGLEPLILKGAPEILGKIKSLLIEIEGGNEANDAMIKMITDAGLREDETFRARSSHGRNRLFVRA